jgi:hypothetical protein
MKTINPNCWALYDEWGAPVPITAPPVANINNLYYSFYLYNSRGLAIFYYRLSGIVLYNVLYENDYFDEED